MPFSDRISSVKSLLRFSVFLALLVIVVNWGDHRESRRERVAQPSMMLDRIGKMKERSRAASQMAVTGRLPIFSSLADAQEKSRQQSLRTKNIRLANKQLADMHTFDTKSVEQAEAANERMNRHLDEDVSTARAVLSEASRDEQRELEKTIDELENARENL